MEVTSLEQSRALVAAVRLNKELDKELWRNGILQEKSIWKR